MNQNLWPGRLPRGRNTPSEGVGKERTLLKGLLKKQTNEKRKSKKEESIGTSLRAKKGVSLGEKGDDFFLSQMGGKKVASLSLGRLPGKTGRGLMRGGGGRTFLMRGKGKRKNLVATSS